MEKTYNGFQIDKKQCIKKLLYRQLGDPLNLFNQIIDNLLDEYILRKVEIADRYLFINTLNGHKFTLSNKCTGFTEDELNALTTVGGSSKRNSGEQLYGTHGIGILSMVNPDFVEEFYIIFFYIPQNKFLCIEFYLEKENLFFKIRKADKNDYKFTCEYTIILRYNYYSYRVEEIIRRQLKYLTSPSFINENQVENEFMNALIEKSDNNCHISIKENNYAGTVYSILYNYKFIGIARDTATFLYAGHNKTNSLEEYIDGFFYSHPPYINKPIFFPFVKNVNIICNSSRLSLTSSKEGFYMDYNYYEIQRFLRLALFEYLNKYFSHLSEEEIVNNIFIFKKPIREYLNNQINIEENDSERSFFRQLIEKKILSIINSWELYSIKEIFLLVHNSDKPLFYTIEGNNLNFASGRFSHDFILTIQRKLKHLGPPDFFDKIFKEIFTDTINLDNIFDSPGTIDKLINRGIVTREDIYPKVQFCSLRDLSNEEAEFIKATEEFFNRTSIRRIIKKVLKIKVPSIRIGLFDVINGDKLVINASFFDQEGNFLLDDRASNFIKIGEKPKISDVYFPSKSVKLFIGLNRSSAELSYVINNMTNQPVEYSLMAICNQLVATQKFISSDSQIYFRLKHYLIGDLWEYIIDSSNNDNLNAGIQAS